MSALNLTLTMPRIVECADGIAIEGMDSLEFLAFIHRIEEEFGVKIPEEDAVEFKDWQSVKTWLGAHNA